MSIVDKFIDVVRRRPSNCVLVVGSGLSKQGVRAGGKGLPDWIELTRLMVDCLENDRRCTRAEVSQLRDWLAEEPPRYLDIADKFSEAYTHDRAGYQRFLRKHLRPDDLVESKLHRLILDIGFRGIVSYNFDLVFEKQAPNLDKIVYPDLLEQVDQVQGNGFFAKIHGCIDRPATQLVLTGKSFKVLSSNRNYRQLLGAIFLTNSVLCVGFSLNDPDFQSILAGLKEFWSTNLPPLMALMLDPGEQVCIDWLKKGVDILPYADHAEVGTFFHELAERCGVRGQGAGSEKRKEPEKTKPQEPPAADLILADLWVDIPECSFLMGAQKDDPRKPNYDADAYDNEAPVRKVKLSAYRIGKYPVTVKQYQQFVDAGGYGKKQFWSGGGFGKFKLPGSWDKQVLHPTRPVVEVSWYEASAYAAWVGHGCRLPTEAEWERAARGLDGRKYPWGADEPTPKLLNFSASGIGRVTPVGEYPLGASADGVLDMAGNVWEWCSDWYDTYQEGDQVDPTGPGKREYRVLRGGSWDADPTDCRSAYRNRDHPGLRGNVCGLRLAAGTLLLNT